MKELEEYAMINKIPIMQKDGILYLCNYIKENNIKSILEIGSAIGYSSIMMANVNNDIMVTTIERDIDRYNIAVDNIKKYNKDELNKGGYFDWKTIENGQSSFVDKYPCSLELHFGHLICTVAFSYPICHLNLYMDLHRLH